ncbi:MAG: hypothetical protein A3B74_00300 [Candidatus Kerfeldbacteria bacterium RIFCSPHIGHO2_02_FULL_42_14]|uniref:IPT/TIG domain-containing protein n=1 Tax=Candidatus Kerfeldbacteria bacterium RIFCSPHIGHO2_02_FULL_42_14 TaxID=1798540 RepID=A0A1G2ATD0_9BACT|nr:MAG: hypothetical protein A3B74_00300 [Candidatus Kerfeldbacteria bacterium RIFCSPHIGHO2_02_FULL_42_14]OGY81283.1 MAG: hypothetical protein A3E60_02430 [Candidatus Kerfeldbacteria bacterium RIFCSPHIGHO2_12_FULL_42_13]OGY83558.1 MAG: hypothetical protein A3I91_02865 [Candidatus Kerfeldbacteria bacterium RIFCSPLOWO2_02_FULL_42_19]OGY87411.1 MAG: hypothetical protein A3G01_04415 [Candidatus Kerfeldbacteria bacterium RIFCSPLOWO2_12_FULL_43_9]
MLYFMQFRFIKLFLFFFFAASIFIFVFQAHTARALEEPALTVSNIQAEAGDTFAIISFTAENVPTAAQATIKYRKDGEDVTFSTGSNYFYDGATSILLYDLLPQTKYFYTVLIEEGTSYEDLYKSSSKSFTTKNVDFVSLSRVTPSKAKPGAEVTIEGKGFGKRAGEVIFGYCFAECKGTIVSWTDIKIVATVGTRATNGPVTVHAYPASGFRSTIYSKEVRGGDVTVNNGDTSYFVIDRRKCGQGIRAKTYNEIANINNIYFAEYGRGAGCNELTFHVQRRTPHDRLRDWLRTQDEGKWWQKITKNYMGKTIYDAKTGIYLVTPSGLRRVHDFQTALAWGLIIDDAKLVEDFYDPAKGYAEKYIHSGVRSYGDYENQLLYRNGPYFDAIEAFLGGEEIDTGNARLDSYIEDHQNLIIKMNPMDTDDEDYRDICTDHLRCGKRY